MICCKPIASPFTPYPLRLVVKMSEHDLEKLLGGFAADTLTPEEKQTLYTAALQDQQLFNALADEQALKELLADPDVRRRLLASLEQKSASGTGWFSVMAGLVPPSSRPRSRRRPVGSCPRSGAGRQNLSGQSETGGSNRSQPKRQSRRHLKPLSPRQKRKRTSLQRSTSRRKTL